EVAHFKHKPGAATPRDPARGLRTKQLGGSSDHDLGAEVEQTAAQRRRQEKTAIAGGAPDGAAIGSGIEPRAVDGHALVVLAVESFPEAAAKTRIELAAGMMGEARQDAGVVSRLAPVASKL